MFFIPLVRYGESHVMSQTGIHGHVVMEAEGGVMCPPAKDCGQTQARGARRISSQRERGFSGSEALPAP